MRESWSGSMCSLGGSVQALDCSLWRMMRESGWERETERASERVCGREEKQKFRPILSSATSVNLFFYLCCLQCSLKRKETDDLCILQTWQCCSGWELDELRLQRHNISIDHYVYECRDKSTMLYIHLENSDH